ncbi:Radical SAM superfamily [Musa troglodytarum]|uniref:Radical SAM superfamily n=1 Tax=Musa troglodytarum TaxID=320322 RepID=A0A9E7H2N6_9LILI|nr:Radical SAM superfamily [Musa troglodytarum]
MSRRPTEAAAEDKACRYHHISLRCLPTPPMAVIVRWTAFSLSSLAFFPSPSATARLSLPRRAFSRFTRHLSLATSPPAYLESGDPTSSKVLLKGMEFTELEKWVKSQGFRSGQALMLWKCLYGSNNWAQSCDELAGLNKEFRKMLSENASLMALSVKDVLIASDGTRKILFTLDDGSVIETVVIPMGLRKHLSTAEIVEQAVFACRLFSSEFGSITNVVFMGMGEPLHNIDNVIKAAAIMVDEQGLHFSPRKVTVSTSGLVPQLKRFLRESTCALAVSLNATTDEVRNWIMPINRKYNLSLLLETLKEELSSKHKYKVLFEYVMLAGVNDSMEDAERLIELVHGIPCKINLISFNPHCGTQFKPTPEEKMIEFRNVLAEAGVVVFLRLSRGDDQMAACGQLGKPGHIQPPLLRGPERFQMAV